METPDPQDDQWQDRVREMVATRQDELTRPDVDQGLLAAQMKQVHDELVQLRMHYQFGIDEVQTKVNILRQEFEQIHDYSPIEHVRSRLKSTESLIEKAVRTGGEMSIPAIRARVHDIAGVRITCSFISDVYWIADMLRRQPDLETLTVKDYIAEPKPNGYRSLHLIVQVPVFLSEHTEYVPVELQLRTIAMDFWASTEHKLSYKYRKNLPGRLRAELDDAARVAADLDARMERMRDEIRPMPDHAEHTEHTPESSPPESAEGSAGAAVRSPARNSARDSAPSSWGEPPAAL